MYPTMLLLHSWFRWAVILAGLLAVARGIAGWKGHDRWWPADERAGLIFIVLLDIQLLIGLLLYFVLSPITQSALQDFGAAMGSAPMRYWAIEHVFGMAVALVLAHLGRIRIRKAPDVRRHRTAAIYFGLALIAILASIPWPGMPAGRPLFRF